ncbi:unnamed protein product [Clonostachys rosea f. rosea IK726]|uniref:Uncharacterized protein n=1 Tax=Clonostachys rosea f. rosea IK726 TaxID=1349383 RepID=A0ACA9TX19_BIOOC|nr:unnamed protein product [Clonostachys rosea f. rosea IK726]
MRTIRGVSSTTTELLSKIIDGDVESAFKNGPVKCHYCGRRTRTSQGMLRHLRQNAKCQERRGAATSPAGHPFIMEHPGGGSANHLQISLPDSPPPPAKSTTNVPEDNMAFSNPAPLEDQNSMPAPLEDQTSMPAPLEDQNSMPAPLEDQNSMPSPLKDQNSMFSPLKDQNSMPSPLKDQISMPSPLKDQNSMPSPLEDQNSMPSPLKDQNSMPSPLEDQNSMPSPLKDQDSMKDTELQHELLESPMPNDGPLNAGDVTMHQGPDCLVPANPCWPGVQDPSAGSDSPASSHEFINAQLMAAQKAHLSLFQQIPVANADAGFICPSYLTAMPVMQQPPPISMGFEGPLILEPMSHMALSKDQSFPPALEPFWPTPQLLGPMPTQHAQGPGVYEESSSIDAGSCVGNQPSFDVPVRSRDTKLYFIRTGLFEPNGGPFSSVGTPSPVATPSRVEEVSDDAGAAVPLNPSTVASMNPLNLPPGQLPLPGGPELGSTPVIHVPQRSGTQRPIQTAAAAVLQRNRVPKPNAPAVMLLIQRGICPTCKSNKPLPGERDMKTHIRCELPYRTTEGQVIMLRGYNPKLPDAFTIDGHGHRNGILMCPFCINRVQVVCGVHPDDKYQPSCSTCRSFMQTGIAHLGAHLRRLEDPRQYVPGHHETCPGANRGCNCVPHYWRVSC